MSRIVPLDAPFEPEVATQLEAMMPPGVPPIALFRTFGRNLPMATAMTVWGSYELSKRLSLDMRTREIVIDRTCALCGCEYEWGVHVAFFADRVGLTTRRVASLTHGTSADACWDVRERTVIDAVDRLHLSNTVDDVLWHRLSEHFEDAQLLDLLLLCGWYHAISFVANGAGVPLEQGAPRFSDYAVDRSASTTPNRVS